MKNKKIDLINKPPHYTFGKIEVIDVIDDWNLGFYEAQVLKYLARYKYKGDPIGDLKKAKWYLDRLISKLDKPDNKKDK